MRWVIIGLLSCLGFVGAAGVASASCPPPACDRGEFCLWDTESYDGVEQHLDLATLNPGSCFALPDGFDGRSFVNLADRLVTVYQGQDCSTEGEFTTYPGGGTYVPSAPFVVRGIEVWEH
jgi:hypothetical protein